VGTVRAKPVEAGKAST
jgi:putative transposase